MSKDRFGEEQEFTAVEVLRFSAELDGGLTDQAATNAIRAIDRLRANELSSRDVKFVVSEVSDGVPRVDVKIAEGFVTDVREQLSHLTLKDVEIVVSAI